MSESFLQKRIDDARISGFSYAAPLAIDTLQPRAEVREMCMANRCGLYGACWTCPPGCGTLEACASRMRRYAAGLLVQTVAPLEDAFDYPGMQKAEALHKQRFEQFYMQLQKEYSDVLALGAGGCTLCARCTYPDFSCRLPTRAVSSMEAYGLLVSDVCRANGLSYRYGPQTVAFTGCYLFR